jgi:hypothetical protein
MKSTKQLFILLLLSIVVTVLLLNYLPKNEQKRFESWDELDNFIIYNIQHFDTPAIRIRHRTFEVKENFSRRTYTVDIPRRYPQTLFHKQLADTLRYYGADTYAEVSFPDRLLTIHIMFDQTLARSIRMQYAESN